MTRPPRVPPSRRATRWRRATLGALAVLVLLAGAGGPEGRPGGPEARPGGTPPRPSATPATRSNGPQFAPDSVFTQPIGQRATDPRSAAMMASLRRSIATRYGGVAAFNSSAYSMSLAVAGADTPRRDVSFDDCQHKGAPSKGLFDGPAHFRNVPIPEDAKASEGTDGELGVWSPDTDQLWEFWKAHQRADGSWQACWGGRIDHVSANRGAFPLPYGVSASGLSSTGSAVRVEEARDGRITHAIGLAIPAPAHWRTVRPPATRSDGVNRASDAMPIGTRLRLDPAVDVDSLGLTAVAAAVARAAQIYGFIVVDTAGAVGVVAESGTPVKARTGQDPWSDLLGGPSYAVMKGFPWDRVVVVAPDPAGPR